MNEHSIDIAETELKAAGFKPIRLSRSVPAGRLNGRPTWNHYHWLVDSPADRAAGLGVYRVKSLEQVADLLASRELVAA